MICSKCKHSTCRLFLYVQNEAKCNSIPSINRFPPIEKNYADIFKILTDDRRPFSIQSCRSRYAPLYLCQCSFYKMFVKFIETIKKNVLKIALIIVNINKDENKSLISNQFSPKNDSPPHTHTHFLENYFAAVKIKNDHKSFLERIDLK